MADSGGERGDLLVLTSVYLVTRVVADAVLGLRFDLVPLPASWQYLDPALLESDLLRSLFYLHAQPPLFNLFLGVVLKLFPGSYATAFALTFRAVALLLVLGVYALSRRVGASRIAALAAATLFSLAGSLLIYETWLFYSLFEAALLLFACLAFSRVMEAIGLRRLVVYWAALVVLALTRATFHLGWVVVVGAAPLFLSGRAMLRSRRAWLIFGGAICLPLCWYVKNAVLFGSFTASSWTGMNVARMIVSNVPKDVRAELVSRGKVSALVFAEPFRPLSSYPPEWRVAERYGHPAVDEPFKSSGLINLNHAAYVRISKQYMADALALMRAYPEGIWPNWVEAWRLFFQPSEVHLFHEPRLRGAFGAYAAAYQRWVLLSVRGEGFKTSLLYLGAFFLALAATAATIRRTWRGRGGANADWTLAFVGLNLVFASLVPNLVEVGENQRFKFSVEPLFWVFLAWGGTRGSQVGRYLIHRFLVPRPVASASRPPARRARLAATGRPDSGDPSAALTA